MAKTTSSALRHQVIYQIFTRNYKNGTFQAVKEDLPRIKALGTDIIYLLPIQPSGEKNRKGTMGSPYAIKDYRAVDPVQGTREEFIALCEATHKAGMKIIIDIVYNHTSPDSVLSKEHPEWFFHRPDGSFGNRVGDWWDVIDLSYDDRGLWRYQIDTLKQWAEHVDGFRCDVAPMVPLEFWLQAREEVEAVRPGCLWIAESVDPQFIRLNRMAGISCHSDAELYQAFDICYDYDVYHKMADVALGKGSLGTYLEGVNLQEEIYPENYIKLRCLENHDRARAAALFPDEKVLRNLTAWNYFQKGTVMLYAGQEFETSHHPTLFDRDTVCFDTGKDLSAYLAKLKTIKQDPLFEYNAFFAHPEGVHKEVIVASLIGTKGTPAEGRKATGIFSTSGRAQILTIDLEDGMYTDAITGSQIQVFEKQIVSAGEPIILFSQEGNPLR